jgi:outer membrane receptor protein involved in Fe transport
MLMKKIYLSLFFLLIFILTSNRSYPGTTGKISGLVTDAATKETLIGANVMLVGTNYGAASDLDGNFFILNIPPGTYTIRASLIGYTSVTITDVKVSVDQTTKIDFELSIGAVELESIVVSAKKSAVQKDLTSTESKISGDDISMLPIEDVDAVVNLQAGVVEGHFRGGRIGEVKYLVDGVSVNDVFSGKAALQAEINSIQEVQILTGTFNAEYGEALSGVVNQVTKIAGEDYAATFSAYTGDYASSRKSLYQNISHISPSDIYNLQGSFSGPVPVTGDFVKFFLSGRYYYNEGYLYGKRVFNPTDSSDWSAGYNGGTGDGTYVPMNYDRKYSVQGKLAFNTGSGKGLVLNTMYSNQEYKDYNHQFKYNPDGDYTKYNTSLLMSLNYTLVFSNSVFMDVSASAMKSDYKQYVYENPLDSRYVNPDRFSDVSGAAFYTGGTQNWHFYHTTKTYSGKIDVTAQVTNIHQIKTGFEYQYHDMDYRDYQIVIDATTDYQPSMPTEGAFNYNIYHNNPYQFAAYIQDKIELEYLIINAGVRFDYFQPSGKYFLDPDNIAALDDVTPPFPDSLFGNSSAKSQFSPRLGISYPMSDNSAIHVSYGHFFQIPPFEYLYKNPNYRIPLTGSYPDYIGTTIGNSDLKPQKTVMYEIGLQQAITPVIVVNLTAYQKDIRNLLATEIHYKNNFKVFSKYINRDYGSVKGITLSFEKMFIDGFGASLDYTYQVAKGSASDANDAYNNSQSIPAVETNKKMVALDWDRRHTLNFTMTGGIPGNFIASCIGTLASGMPYTPSSEDDQNGIENSENRPGIFNVDLYLTKYVTVLGQQISFFIKVYNLFDTANETDVYTDTGRAGYTLSTTTESEPTGYNTLAEYYTRPDFYSSPRQIVIGGSYGF